MWHRDLFHKQNSLWSTVGLFQLLGKEKKGVLMGRNSYLSPFPSRWAALETNCPAHCCITYAKDFIFLFTREATWKGSPVLKLSGGIRPFRRVQIYWAFSKFFAFCWMHNSGWAQQSAFPMNKQLFLSETDHRSLCFGLFEWCGWPSQNGSGSERTLGLWSSVIPKQPPRSPPWCGTLPVDIRCCETFRRIGAGV